MISQSEQRALSSSLNDLSLKLLVTIFPKLSLKKKMGTSLTHFLVLGRSFIPVHVLKNMKIQPDFTGQNWLKILKIASQKTHSNVTIASNCYSKTMFCETFTSDCRYMYYLSVDALHLHLGRLLCASIPFGCATIESNYFPLKCTNKHHRLYI